MPLKYSANFVASIETLIDNNGTDDLTSYYSFIENFGTHYLTSFKSGAKYGEY